MMEHVSCVLKGIWFKTINASILQRIASNTIQTLIMDAKNVSQGTLFKTDFVKTHCV